MAYRYSPRHKNRAFWSTYYTHTILLTDMLNTNVSRGVQSVTLKSCITMIAKTQESRLYSFCFSLPTQTLCQHWYLWSFAVFQIMDETQTQIAWPSKLKIGAKSKKGDYSFIPKPIFRLFLPWLHELLLLLLPCVTWVFAGAMISNKYLTRHASKSISSVFRKFLRSSATELTAKLNLTCESVTQHSCVL